MEETEGTWQRDRGFRNRTPCFVLKTKQKLVLRLPCLCLINPFTHVCKGKCSRTQQGSHACVLALAAHQKRLGSEYNPTTGAVLVHDLKMSQYFKLRIRGKLQFPRLKGTLPASLSLKEMLSSHIISVYSGHGLCFAST